MKNCYTILGLKPGASSEEIKRAYYLLAKETHPDSGDKAEVKKFYVVTEAYQILSNPGQREVYDRTLKTGKLESLATPLEYSAKTHGPMAADHPENMTSLRSQMLWMALAKVALTVLVAGVVGRTLAVLIEASRGLGSFAGAAFGLVWAANWHFDIPSFLASPAQARLARWGGRALMAFSVGYFVAMFLMQMLVNR